MLDIDVYEMQIFLTAAETGSFSEAGRRLQMSQPAVSQQIRSLETRLNIELFHRSGRHIRLTELGESLVPLARDLVNHTMSVQEEIQSLKGEITGVLRLACSTTAGKYILPRIIAGYIEQYPAVQVVCHVGSRGTAIENLLAGEAHLAITSLEDVSKDLEYRPFIRDRVILIAHPEHAWSQREAITVDALMEENFIQRETNSGTYQTVARALTEHNISMSDLHTVMVLGNSEAIYNAVAQGIGVGFISHCAASDGLTTGRVIEVPVKNLWMSQQLFVVRHATRLMPGAPSAFWDYLYATENRYLLMDL